MAALKDVNAKLDEIDALVKDLRSATHETDLGDQATVADQISETADGLAELFNSIDASLHGAIGGKKSAGKDDEAKK